MSEKISYKKLDIAEFEIENVKGDDGKSAIYISGYANTKGHPDSYGDIPTNFKNKPIYDLSRMKKKGQENPVMLIDHINSASRIMAAFTLLKEDDIGLKFKAKLKDIETECFSDDVKEAVFNFGSGFAKALSIGGIWLFEDPDNPRNLTKAIIHEISGVAVGADGQAVTDKERIKSISGETNKDENSDMVKSTNEKYGKENANLIRKQVKEIEEVTNESN